MFDSDPKFVIFGDLLNGYWRRLRSPKGETLNSSWRTHRHKAQCEREVVASKTSAIHLRRCATQPSGERHVDPVQDYSLLRWSRLGPGRLCSALALDDERGGCGTRQSQESRNYHGHPEPRHE
jgi:hypothetical protein